MPGSIMQRNTKSYRFAGAIHIFSLLCCFLYIITVSDTKTNTVEKSVGEGEITPEACEGKIINATSINTKCFRIDQAEVCSKYCVKVGEKRCGGTKGVSLYYQCTNKQNGSKKACCCEFKCEPAKKPLSEIKKQFTKMKGDKSGLPRSNIVTSKEDTDTVISDQETQESPGLGSYGDPFEPENVNDGHFKKRR